MSRFCADFVAFFVIWGAAGAMNGVTWGSSRHRMVSQGTKAERRVCPRTMEGGFPK